MYVFVWYAEGTINHTIVHVNLSQSNRLHLNCEKCIKSSSFKIIIYSYLDYNLNTQPYNLNFILSLKLDDILFRLKNIIIYSAYYSLKNIFFFLGIIILIILNFKKKIKFEITTFNIYFLLNSFFIVFAYLLRDMEIIYALKTTMERIIFTSSAIYIHLFILYVTNYFKINK